MCICPPPLTQHQIPRVHFCIFFLFTGVFVTCSCCFFHLFTPIDCNCQTTVVSEGCSCAYMQISDLVAHALWVCFSLLLLLLWFSVSGIPWQSAALVVESETGAVVHDISWLPSNCGTPWVVLECLAQLQLRSGSGRKPFQLVVSWDMCPRTATFPQTLSVPSEPDTYKLDSIASNSHQWTTIVHTLTQCS